MLHKKPQQKAKSVCHISTVHPHTDVRVFYRECCSLVEDGYEVNLVIPCGSSCIKDGVKLHAIPRFKNRLLRMLFMPWVAMFAALKTKSSIYHYHDPELIFMGFVLRWIFGKKVVFDIHEFVVRQIAGKPYLPPFTRKPISICYGFLERIFTTGQALIIANEHTFTAYSQKSYLVQNYPVLKDEIVAAASTEKQTDQVPHLIYVGGVSKVRGAELSVDLAAKLAERGHDFTMQLIGPYSDEFGREMKLKIEKLNLQSKVFFSGHMDWVEAMELTSKATIGMCLLLPIPNYTTCLATKIIEYMMCGTPVLCSKFDHWRPYVEGEKTGMMADPENLEEVVEVCEKMLSDPDALKTMRKNGIEAAHAKYNWESEFNELLKCYEVLLEK